MWQPMCSSHLNLLNGEEVTHKKRQRTISRQTFFYIIIYSIISGLTQRFEAVITICNRFDFLWCFKDIKETELKEKAAQFHKTYSRRVSPHIESEILSLKSAYDANFKAETPCPKELYGEIHAMGLNALFPNVLTALRVFHTLPASVASNERSFRVLKRIKNYLRSNMAQERQWPGNT